MTLPEPPSRSEITAATSGFSDEVWVEVLREVDRTYAGLVGYQEQLERQNLELERLRQFLGSILGSVSDVLIATSRGGLVEEISASMIGRTGRARADLIGSSILDLVDPRDRAALQAAQARVEQQRTAATIEVGLLTGTGPTPLELNLAPRLDDRGRVAGMVLTGRPLGELRLAYEALKTTQGQLVRNEKLASLGRLLAGVAHELNNPISFVYANTHAMERYVGKFETYFARVQAGASREELVALREELRLDREVRNLREAVQGAHAGAERVRDIVADLRRLSSDGAGDLVVFDLVETTQVAAHWVLRGSKQAVTVRFTGLERLEVLGRPGHIQQVVMNLVQNAVDVLEPLTGGQIVIDHAVLDAMLDGPRRAALTVGDNGPGIAESVAQVIFDPFFTTKPVGRGTGLGLSISHKIAEEHGGSLRLLSGQPQATAFRLELPLAGGAAA